MNLYHVQDSDRPLWVVATDYIDAIERWHKVIVAENPGDPGAQVPYEPQGVHMICDATELLLPDHEGPLLNKY